VLTDFGLARAADDVALTRWGIIAGTPEYMSPEQARGEPLDGRSDLFSLGCVLYEMATGVSPFRTDSAMATMRRLVDDSSQPMASLNPELPPWFIAIVDRLLEKDPSRRFGSAKEVSELLEGCLAHVQQPANVHLPVGLPQSARRRASRSWRIGIIGALAMIVASVIGLFAVVLSAAAPPDIAGEWSGEEWGHVVLKKTSGGEYTGTYSETIGKPPGQIYLKWSRIERRFNGTWSEGEDRFGDLSVRLVGDEIRGGFTTDPKSKINPATPRLADLLWIRGQQEADKDKQLKMLAEEKKRREEEAKILAEEKKRREEEAKKRLEKPKSRLPQGLGRDEVGVFDILGGGVPLSFLTHKSVQEDLKMTDEQVKKADATFQKHLEAEQRARSLPDQPARFQKELELSAEAYEAVKDILNADQQKRLQQISLQQVGVRSLARRPIAKELGLSEDQQSEITGLIRNAGKRARDYREEADRTKVEEIEKKLNDQALGVLTSEQKTKWNEMTGKPFSGPKLMVRWHPQE
jgi:hypothetical protein